MRKITWGLITLVMTAGMCRSALANEFTDVIDAFDDDNDDPFDISLDVGYETERRTATIRREVIDGSAPHSWDFFQYRDMFEFKHVTHFLNLNLEVGLFKDLALRVGMPIILKDTRVLKAHDDLSWENDGDGEGVGALIDLQNNKFESPNRSGLDHLTFGLWWGILDQGRDDTKPNWTVFAQGMFAVGEDLKAACKTETPTCTNTDGGISRGLNQFHFGTRLSRRYGLIDPYFGFDALVSWPRDGTVFNMATTSTALINDMPPVVGTLDFGVEIIPWEQPGAHRKLSIGVGGGAKYHSEGRDYTPLFDALGMSSYFNDQTFVDFNNNGEDDSNDPDAGPLTAEGKAVEEWSGMSDIENYATFFGKLFVMMQPAKYVKFLVGMSLAHETEHFITKTDECAMGNIEDGLCTDYNLGHRPEIDKPGRRFRAEGTFLFNFFVEATAMF